MRSLAGLIVIASLGGAFLFAPFQHIHEPGRADRHVAEHHSSGLALHIHIPGSSTTDASWQAADESARLLKLFRAKEGKTFSFEWSLTAVAVVDSARTQETLAREIDLVVDEPPPRFRPSPRGPPA